MPKETTPEQKAKRAAYYREYRQKNKERCQEYNKRYYESHKDECRARTAEWRKKNLSSDLAKKYQAKYRERYKLIYRLGKEALDKMEAENGNQL